MHLGHGNESYQYVMNGVNLEASEHEKDRGVMVDDKLRFHLRTIQVVAKAFRVLGMIKRSFEDLNRKTIPLLFRRRRKRKTQKRTKKVGKDEVVMPRGLNLADLLLINSARVVIQRLKPSECLQYGVSNDGGDRLDPFPSQTVKDSETQIKNEQPKVHQSAADSHCKPPLPLGCIIMFVLANTKSELLIEQLKELLKLLFPFYRNRQTLSKTLNRALTIGRFMQYYSFISRKNEDTVWLKLKKCKQTNMKLKSVFDQLSEQKRILRDSLSCPDLVDFLLQMKGDLHTWIVNPSDQVKLDKCAEPTRQNNFEVEPKPVVKCKCLAVTHLEENIAVENMSAAVISQQVVEKLDKTSVQSGSEQSILQVGRKCIVGISDKTSVQSESKQNMQKNGMEGIVMISDETSVQSESKKKLPKEERKDTVEMSESKRNMQKNGREGIVRISDETSVQSESKKNLPKEGRKDTVEMSESKQNMQKDGREGIVRISDETSVQSESKKNLPKEGRKDTVEMSESKQNMQKDGREGIVRISDETSVQSESKKNLPKEGRKDTVEMSESKQNMQKNGREGIVKISDETSVQSESKKNLPKEGRKDTVEMSESKQNMQKDGREGIVRISIETSVQSESKKNLPKEGRKDTVEMSESKQNMQKDGREGIVRISDETSVQSESKKNLPKEGRKDTVEMSESKQNMQKDGREGIVRISDETSVQSESKKNLPKEGRKNTVEMSESKQNMQKDGREGIVRISDETSIQSESKKNLPKEGRKDTVEMSESKQNMQKDGREGIVRISDETSVQSESKKNLQRVEKNFTVGISDKTRVQSEIKKNILKLAGECIVGIPNKTSVQSESNKNIQKEGRKDTVEGSDKTSIQSGSEQNIQSDGGEDIARKEDVLGVKENELESDCMGRNQKSTFSGLSKVSNERDVEFLFMTSPKHAAGQSSTSAPLNDKGGFDLPAHYSASNGTSNTVYENINIDNPLPISPHLIGETFAEFGDVDAEISWPVSPSQLRVHSMGLENLGVENPRSRSPSQLRVPNASEDDVSTVALVDDNITENSYDSDIIITDVKPRAWELWFPTCRSSSFHIFYSVNSSSFHTSNDKSICSHFCNTT
ncbi:hypothetical protein Pcinc_024221 [Petrolisthes cinctipes]|uniref:Uncharacterized protein n=1 Tax=Petrolisthes cinctipes TaxID=88211 RepID=A0AAE1FBI9_PETCI|nr:hypothetical protein Pcinc_024221 [Petrolisthes cinctipes]